MHTHGLNLKASKPFPAVLVKNNESAIEGLGPGQAVHPNSTTEVWGGVQPATSVHPSPPPPGCTCDGLCLRTDGPCGGLGLGGRHCLFRYKLDRAGGCHRRAGQLAAALLVSYEGIQVAELLLTDTADVDVRCQLYQDRGASGDSMGPRKNHRLISDQCHGRRQTRSWPFFFFGNLL